MSKDSFHITYEANSKTPFISDLKNLFITNLKIV